MHPSNLRATRTMAIIGAALALERWTPVGRPTSATGVPASADHIRREWLSAVLCSGTPGAEVLDFALERDSSGSTTHRAITIGYNPVGADAGLPTRLFTKSTPSFRTRLLNMSTGALYCEAGFYERIRPVVDIEAPAGHHMGISKSSGRSMFLIEDVQVTRHARFGNSTTLTVTEKMARTQMELLARLHATLWESPLFNRELRFLRTTKKWLADAAASIDFEGRSIGAGIDRAGASLPAELLLRRSELWAAYLKTLDLNVEGPLTIQHQDLHLGNWYATADDRMGLFDWQCMAIGGYAKDVAYAIAASLTVEDRRAWERSLIMYYTDLMNEQGVPLEFDDVWLSYRQQTLHALFFWLYTIGYGPLQPKMQPDDVCLANIERMSQAVVDLETLKAIGF